MKKTMLIATFLAVGAGSAGVSAVDLKGSDTLKEFTLSVINAAVCPGATSLVYIGGGSGSGETAMTTSPVKYAGGSSQTTTNRRGASARPLRTRVVFIQCLRYCRDLSSGAADRPWTARLPEWDSSCSSVSPKRR